MCFMVTRCYTFVLAMLMTTAIVRGIAAEPVVLLDKDFSKNDQKTDFAGRGRLAIQVETASPAAQFYRLSIDSRDTTRSPVYLSLRSGSPTRVFWSGSLDPNETWTQRTFHFQLE